MKQILSPHADDAGVWIHQNAWFNLGEFEEVCTSTYILKQKGNGLYFFVLEGEVMIKDYKLGKRDGLAITETRKVEFKVSAKTKVLLMEVPMFDI